jgi:hypothetical protein
LAHLPLVLCSCETSASRQRSGVDLRSHAYFNGILDRPLYLVGIKLAEMPGQRKNEFANCSMVASVNRHGSVIEEFNSSGFSDVKDGQSCVINPRRKSV